MWWTFRVPDSLKGAGTRIWGWEGGARVAEIQGHGVRAIWAFGKVSKLGSGGRGWGGVGRWEPLGCSMMNQSRRLREHWGKGGAQGKWPLEVSDSPISASLESFSARCHNSHLLMTPRLSSQDLPVKKLTPPG